MDNKIDNAMSELKSLIYQNEQDYLQDIERKVTLDVYRTANLTAVMALMVELVGREKYIQYAKQSTLGIINQVFAELQDFDETDLKNLKENVTSNVMQTLNEMNTQYEEDGVD